VAITGALLLVFVLMVRPQEFVPGLQALSPVNVCAALAALGIVSELALGKQPPVGSPQLPWLGAFVGWCFLVTVRRLGVADGLSGAWEFVGLSAIIMLVVVYAARTLSRWRALAGLLVAVAVLLACTCIHQSRQEAQCIAIDTSSALGERSGEGEPDGRECDTAWVCEQNGRPRQAYACEKIGLFGTFTEGRRVRWRGTLGDPNELALALGAILPLSFAFASVHRQRMVTAAVAGVLGLILWCVVLTGSRGGQLVVLTVLGVYFVRRYGFKGAILGAIFALPVLLLGGRSGEEADSSSLERIDLLYEGMDMIRSYPVLGVGAGQFIDHASNGMTAHNSYVLAAAELGLPGSLLWTMLVYTSVKIPWLVASRPPAGLDEAFRPFALALVVAFAGILVGVFFLSFCYKALLFVFFGLSGALYGAVRRACPEFDVRVSWREVARLAVVDAAVLVFVFVYSRLKGGHA
jgi:hypothetical protein